MSRFLVGVTIDCSSVSVLPDELFGASVHCAERMAHFEQYEAEGRLSSAPCLLSEGRNRLPTAGEFQKFVVLMFG